MPWPGTRRPQQAALGCADAYFAAAPLISRALQEAKAALRLQQVEVNVLLMPLQYEQHVDLDAGVEQRQPRMLCGASLLPSPLFGAATWAVRQASGAFPDLLTAGMKRIYGTAPSCKGAGGAPWISLQTDF